MGIRYIQTKNIMFILNETIGLNFFDSHIYYIWYKYQKSSILISGW